MKSYLLIPILFLLILLESCSKQDGLPTQISENNGNVVLKIDKENAPKGIVLVTAYLSREGYDTLKSSMNLLTDSTAGISLNRIEVGVWHLKVEAKNSSNVVMFSGENDVEIKEHETVQVNLILQPTGNGIGNIDITVGWGKVPNWSDYYGNPIFSKVDSYSPFGVASSNILIDGSVFRMWYRNQDAGGVSTIGYAISEDGITWTSPVNHPVLYPGSYGTWDSFAVTDGVVIKEENGFRMYYRGTNVHSGYAAIGMATSADGILWEKRPSPIMTPNESETAIGPHSVIKVGGYYYLYYDMVVNSILKVGLAVSADGLNWTRYSGNPIISPTRDWEGIGTYYASVIYDDNIFKMVYMNYNDNGWALGKATSTDGKNWVKSELNPVFSGQKSVNNWTAKVVFPCLRKFGNEYRIYYTSGEYPYKIGLIKSSTF